MSELITSKTINASQLCYELNGAPLNLVGPEEDGTTSITSSITQSALDAAVASHIANPNWIDPNYVPPAPPTAAEKLFAKTGLTVEEYKALGL